MNVQRKSTLLLLILGLVQIVNGQQLRVVDYFTGIKEVDLSQVWLAVTDRIQDSSIESLPPEPLGFIGDHYQRFYIHYTAVVKSKTNLYQYIVHGKTKVKDLICNFTGTITIIQAGIYRDQVDKNYKQGYVKCLISFAEDSTQKSTGSFRGKLTSKFCLNENNRVLYDDLLLGADGYFNNQCEAVWTSYETKARKTVNWGDYRIPAAKALDIGDGEFAVNKAYLTFGWQNYSTAWSGDAENETTKLAQQKEQAQWWETTRVHHNTSRFNNR